MNGSVFILNENGLYCSNDADFLNERIPIRDESGKITATKHTQVIRVMNYFKIWGELSDKQEGFCQFKFDETDEVKTFSMTINGFTPNMIILNLKALNLRNKEVTETIKNKIKEEINYGS